MSHSAGSAETTGGRTPPSPGPHGGDEQSLQPPGGGVSGDVHPATSKDVLARETEYAEAQRVVDDLSDRGFPVEHLAIVGRGLSSVERVTGRLTKARAALQGAAGGAWFGLLVGLLIGLFAPPPAWLALIAVSVVVGAAFGAVFGFVAHWNTRGRRDFSSVRTLAAEEYCVTVDPAHADQARRLLV